MVRVLVVEDDARLNQIVCASLRAAGYEAIGCANAAQATDVLHGDGADIIISDIMMPGVDGFEFVSEVRSVNRHIPILLMTALDDMSAKRKGFGAGIDDYMVKPIDVDELLLRIEALLRRALDDAGYDYVPVLTNDDVDAHNAHPGFKLGLGPSIQIAYGLPMIDTLEAMLRRIRPYELEKGAADAAFDRALDEVIEGMERSGLRGQATGFKRALAIMDAVPYDRSNPHPTVLIVGEYLLNFHLGANHEIERYLEDNGLEVIEARMTDVIRKTYFYKHAQSREFHVDLSLPEKAWYATADNLFELAHDRCDRLGAASPLYEPPTRMPELVRASDKILHHTFDAGEGVLIPAEILEHAKRGCRNFVILQPFGCLPNHVVGRGLIHALKEQYPTAQFLPLDYDPDVSFANVENRLQMLIMNAKAQGCGEAHGETA